MNRKNKNIAIDLLLPLLFLSVISMLLLVLRIFATDTLRLSFLLWNLFLAWLPLIFAVLLYINLPKIRPLRLKDIVLFFLWISFLPNSFYLISDFIHLQSSGEVSLLYDTAMITSFVLNGIMLGYISLYIVHKLLNRYLSNMVSHAVTQFILLLCAFAIYLGRYLRWNTWDILINPAGLIFDVSDRIIYPITHLHTFIITIVFYVLLGSIYFAIYRLVDIAKSA